ncbi:predicted protein [Phaeodactylum tricornutum CCAP 1055/1]|uniref:O-methyltransferase n=1 Tax=Phaeodactylum tricornutum (strain CCAP 1055/1) TaxID=556484 RepID=B7GC32_PHATC|nr:predicted protein [Phaeodactylum tricornutum CCAP 1055/1]EEC43792.1 predicted protein [Phaeodactylum tricornutum CCAP 1055/1]|eukprot:XP_002184733.1 predicted protein [Phaeodactylum tricornutum CCAP 1055/1]
MGAIKRHTPEFRRSPIAYAKYLMLIVIMVALAYKTLQADNNFAGSLPELDFIVEDLPSQTALAIDSSLTQRQKFEVFRQSQEVSPWGGSATDAPLFERLCRKHSDIFGFGHGGRDITDGIIRELAKNDAVVIMEVGVWLGQSTARWLNVHPNVRVIAVDPFSAPNGTHKKLSKVAEEDKVSFGQPEFNRALAQFAISKAAPGAHDRVVFETGLYPQAAQPLFQASKDERPAVDLFYLDGGKRTDTDAHLNFVEETIRGIVSEFPDVILSGDDWGFSKRFRSLIVEFAEGRNRSVYVGEARTWIMINDQDPRFSNAQSLLGKKVALSVARQ